MRRGARDSWAQSAAGSVPSLTPQRPWSHGGTSGTYNSNYLQPQWGNEAKMLLQRQWRSRGDSEIGERGRAETSDWPLLPCNRVSQLLRESKPSNLISRRRDFLRAHQGNSLCHKSWRQARGRMWGSSLNSTFCFLFWTGLRGELVVWQKASCEVTCGEWVLNDASQWFHSWDNLDINKTILRW